KGAALLGATIVAVAFIAGTTAVASNRIVVPGLSGDSAGGSATPPASTTTPDPSGYTLEPGVWGSRDLRLTVTAEGAAVLLFECGHGHIPAPLRVSAGAAFAWEGVYRAELGASTSVPGPDLPATYEGSVAGDMMTIEVDVKGGFLHRTFALAKGHTGPQTTCITGQ
ncbi:MAG: hypothetical protein KC495_10520, partial [Dehalococcoidia bacterium]|nr:hypothetical protein [Dehalococcoidia bacterium]